MSLSRRPFPVRDILLNIVQVMRGILLFILHRLLHCPVLRVVGPSAVYQVFCEKYGLRGQNQAHQNDHSL
jgi:hypothetical protein